ncbi:MAG TPA: AAA family ATPase [Candidatus Paceibacterota bacterium]
MKIYYLTGVSGAGKSAVAKKLAEKGVFSIDVDSVKGLCHWRDKNTEEIAQWHPGMTSEWYKSHKYIWDREKLNNLIKNSGKNTIVIAGLAHDSSELWDLFDKVFLLYCNKETFIKRITERENHDFGKHSLEKEYILSWHKDFENEMLEGGAVPINTEHPLMDVVEEIYYNLTNLK